MHYRNGREARPGDPVVWLSAYGQPAAGIVHSINPGATTCNARLAQPTPNDPYVNLSDCVHADDVGGAFPHPPPPEPEVEAMPRAAEPRPAV